MAQQWYYADRQRQQRGPVAADELVAALRRGDVDMSTLVWHERLPGWVPLAQVAAELGVQGAPPPVPRSAPGPRAAPRTGGGGRTVLIVVGVLLGCLVVFGGIFAAIAIPAYSDYTLRTRINQAYIVASSERIAVAEFYMTNERCPVNGDEGFGPAEGYSAQYLSGLEFGPGPDGCEIRAKLQGLNQPRLGDAQLTLNLDRNHNWTSTANIPNRYLPTAMRR
jgi:type IV pilus assembly protein PilA